MAESRDTIEQAVVYGARDYLRAALGLRDYSCEVVPYDTQVPLVGDVHLGILPGGFTSPTMDAIAEDHAIEVTISVRRAPAPRSRPQLMLDKLLRLAQAACNVINTRGGNYLLLASINRLLPPWAGVFTEPHKQMSLGQVQPRDGTFYGVEPQAAFGYARILRISGIRRYASAEETAHGVIWDIEDWYSPGNP